VIIFKVFFKETFAKKSMRKSFKADAFIAIIGFIYQSFKNQMKQLKLTVQSKGRGYYLITNQIQEALKNSLAGVDVGLLHVFLQHSSASLTINENADSTVREDFKNFEEKLVPRSFPYKHNYEGDDVHYT
jgi:hypothetical protein